MNRRSSLLACAIVAMTPLPVSAQNKALPPAKVLAVSGSGVTTSGPMFARPTQVRQLSDGRVLVNDPGARLVLLLDATLGNATRIIDSAANGPTRSYGRWPATLLGFAGVTSLFFDPAALAFVVIDPSGRLGRVMSSPIPSTQVASILGSTYSYPVYSPSRGLLYTSAMLSDMPTLSRVPGSTVSVDDSSVVVVAHFGSQTIDTITAIKRDTEMGLRTASGLGSYSLALFPAVDEWSGFADGTVGVLRGHELRIELYPPNGERRVLPKIPFDWQRVSDEFKRHYADSVDTARMQSYRARLAAAANGTAPTTSAAGAISGMGTGAARAGGGGGGAGGGGVAEPSGGRIQPPAPFNVAVLPDYFPMFAKGGMRGDLDGNFWIQIAQRTPDAPTTYVVVDRSGAVVQHVIVPTGTTLIGFGPNAVTYLSAVDGATAQVIRTHWRN